MTDSTDNNTNELDSYGVWVKRPSKASSDETPANNDAESFNLDADLPDFSEIDISSVASDISADTEDKLQDDTTLSTEELSDITDTINTSEIPETPAQTETEVPEKLDEVSLEDFLDEGFSDPGASSASGHDSDAKEESPAASGESEDISLDDFLDSDFSADEPEKQDKEPDEAPLDIDLSFSSDEPSAESPESLLSETESADFNIPSEQEKSSEDTDTIGSDNFDDMFSSITDTPLDTEPFTEAKTSSAGTEDEPEHKEDSSSLETENIDLSDFGIDAEAEETPITTNIAENKPKSAAVDYDLSVTEEDSAAPAPVVNEIKSAAVSSAVPDTFDEETNSLISTPSNTPSEKPETTAVNNTLLQQIVADLSGLKNEISSLKNDFAELKAHEERTAAGASGRQTAKGGFFAEQDEDDTISLSGDELDNIMNTADFSDGEKEAASSPEVPSAEETIEQYEEIPSVSDETETVPQEAPVSELADENLFGTIDSSVQVPETPAVDDTTSSDLTMNFDNEKLEEPDLNDLSSDTSSETVPDELPEEISIPKVDDILVESSSTDFMDSVKDTTEAPFAEEEPADLSASPAESSVSDSGTEQFAEPKADDTTAEDIFPQEPSVADSLTKDNIDYLNTDESVKEEPETGTQEEEKTPSEEKTQSLPDDLTQEVKSVLLYMDQLLENLPEDKIIEFARSEHFATYKKLFSDLGLS